MRLSLYDPDRTVTIFFRYATQYEVYMPDGLFRYLNWRMYQCTIGIGALVAAIRHDVVVTAFLQTFGDSKLGSLDGIVPAPDD